MRILELFSGSHSIGKACKSTDEVVSLDLINNPTICQDILTWDYKVYPVGHFDYIHASPPCTAYSLASHIFYKDRDFTLADSIVMKTLEIIEYFQPSIWTIENPQTGYLKTRGFMQSLDYTDTDYCKYGSSMKKKTRFWSNHKFILKHCKRDCKSLSVSPKGRLIHGNWNKYGCGQKNKLSTASYRAIIPHRLCKSIMKQINNTLNPKPIQMQQQIQLGQV